MENFKNWLESSQNSMQGFHVTNNENVQSILQNGFDLGKSRKFELGLGVYLSPSLWGLKPTQDQSIIECNINTSNFLDITSQSNFESFSSEEQKSLVDLLHYVPPNIANSPLMKKVQQTFRGLVLQRMIVCYHPEDVKPHSIVGK